MVRMDDYDTGYRVDRESVDSMELDGEAVLLNLQTHGYFGLNVTGTEVWELVKAHPGIPAPEIIGALGQRYGQDPAAIVAGVAAVIDEMLGHGLLTTADPSTLSAIRVDPCDRPYLAPSLQAYGNLDTLILSGE